MNKPTKIETATLHSAMALAFAEISAATKSADNPFFKSKYADLPSVIAAVKPALAEHGLFFTQHCHPSETGVIVETVLHHCNGESLSMGSLYVPANKKDPQGFGSAQTYARRYALQTAFGVPVEDDDGNAAVKAMSDTGSLTKDQWETLEKKADEVGADKALFCQFLKVSSIRDIPASRYQEALDALAAKKKTHA